MQAIPMPYFCLISCGARVFGMAGGGREVSVRQQKSPAGRFGVKATAHRIRLPVSVRDGLSGRGAVLPATVFARRDRGSVDALLPDGRFGIARVSGRAIWDFALSCAAGRGFGRADFPVYKPLNGNLMQKLAPKAGIFAQKVSVSCDIAPRRARFGSPMSDCLPNVISAQRRAHCPLKRFQLSAGAVFHPFLLVGVPKLSRTIWQWAHRT
jgi:hypothetical protein